MFTAATPESVGISSAALLKYLKILNEHGLSTHSVLIARGDKLLCEAYWKPFTADQPHRMYSQTKSYVGLAIRLLAEEGKLSLDDKIIHYFPDKLPETVHPFLEKQTIRNMLMMRTCFDEGGVNWFTARTDDRVKLYFAQRATVYPGTQYHYDSFGSFVLGALVERLTGKTFLDYLREKCLDRLGFAESTHCLYCPGGAAWSDSSLLCTPLDMLKYGRFIGTRGQWEGEQLVSRSLFDEAFSERTDLGSEAFFSFSHGGYISQFWNYRGNAVGFNGMHDQLTVYDPDTDITFTCTSGNVRGTASREILISYLFSEIIDTASSPLPENEAAYRELREYISSLSLVTASGEAFSPLENEISGRLFKAEANSAGITEYSFTFAKDACDFRYVNAQGEKHILLGRKQNTLGTFPETGYSDRIGGTDCPGHTYRCASSFAWGTENQLKLKIQIIDEYIGNLHISFAYRDGYGRLRLQGDAENFLWDYNGVINSFAENK